jgi:hypothetical protein
VVAGSVVVSVVVVLVCANASGAINVQARAIIVLFIYASLICCFDRCFPSVVLADSTGFPGLQPVRFSLGRLQAARIRSVHFSQSNTTM